MPSFALDSGQLVPAAIGQRSRTGLGADERAALREHLLDVLQADLFAIGWSSEDVPVFTAMDASGHVVTAVVLERLDGPALTSALAHAGETAATPWLALAGRYRSGVPGFRRDWNTFRESRAPGAEPGPSLYLVAGTIAPEVISALPVLRGVRVFAVDVREGADQRRLLDVSAVEPGRATVRAAAPVAAPVAGPEPPEPAAPVAGPEPAAPVEPATAAEADTGPVPVVVPVEEDLVAVAALVQAPVALRLRCEKTGAEHAATLDPDGALTLADGSRHAQLGGATASALGWEPPDAWSAWRFDQGGFTLADARAEVARFASLTPAQPPSAPREGMGRRALRALRSR